MSKGSPGRPGGGFRAVAALLVGALVWDCSDRDRLTFTTPGNGIGPTTVIDDPSKDTAIQPGPLFPVSGRSIDPDSVDTVYFRTVGGILGFPPLVASSDTVHFGLQIATQGLSGQTITLLVFGTDKKGNRGDTVTRSVTIQ
jgi:hypothetical protein